MPLTSDELESAAQEPAARSGVTLEPALLAELLADVIGEPGALPIFQYALTELFDRREGDVLTAAAYRAMGGVRGALSRRADDLYHRLTLDEQEAARQLFLRLVTITEHDDWGRRRVPASEIVSMDVDVVTMESVIDQLGPAPVPGVRPRPQLGGADGGGRPRGVAVGVGPSPAWIEEGRHDVQRRAVARRGGRRMGAGRARRDYLLAGNRLAEYERWRASTSMSLTAAEQDYLDVSLSPTATRLRPPSRREPTARPAPPTRPAPLVGALVAGAAALAAVADWWCSSSVQTTRRAWPCSTGDEGTT